MRRPRYSRSGQVLVKAPAMLILFLGIAAIAVDLGFYHSKKTQAQAAAEATAFAAAYRASGGLVPSGDSTSLADIEADCEDIADLNAPGCDTPVFEWGCWNQDDGFYIPNNNLRRNAVRVTVAMDQPTFFTMSASGQGRRVIGRAVVLWTPYGDVWPMCLASSTRMHANEVVTFGPDTGNNVPGNKGWLSFNGSNNVPDLEVYIDGGPYGGGTPNPWGDIFDQWTTASYQLNNGNSGASIEVEGAPGLKKGAKDRVEAQVEAGAIVLVPIFDDARMQGANSWYKIVGFLPIQLIPPYDDLHNIQARILSDGPLWFPANSNVTQSMRNRIKPSLDLVMVE